MRTAALAAAAFALGAHGLQQVPHDAVGPHVSLIQGSAEVEGTLNFGEYAAISESGYQSIAELQDDNQMLTFIQRVLASEARHATDLGQLNGLVPHYSGTIAVQDLASLQKDLRKAPWVSGTEGRTVSISQDGYHKVAALQSKPDMIAFSRRILDKVHRAPDDDKALAKLADHFDGSPGRGKTFMDLQEAVLKLPSHALKDGASIVFNPDLSLLGHTTKISEDGASVEIVTPKPMVNLIQGSVQVEEALDLSFAQNATLSESGYRSVAALKDDNQMTAFIHRVLASEAHYATDLGELSGLVPHYSGTIAVQDLQTLRKDLRKAPWVAGSEGRTAALSADGFRKVAALQNKPDMVAFARRILDKVRRVPDDEKALAKLAEHFDGKPGNGKTFVDLQQAVMRLPSHALKDGSSVVFTMDTPWVDPHAEPLNAK